MHKIVVFVSIILSCTGEDKYKHVIELLSNIRPRNNILEPIESSESAEGHPFANYEKPTNPNLNHSFFCDIEDTIGVMTKEVNETDYPWIARVVHSVDGMEPLLCTAVAIMERIFITAAGCVYTSKVSYSSVLYQHLRLRPKAFVVPTKPTKQLFDDIGLIVVHESYPGPNWQFLNVIDTPRTDQHFVWFYDLDLGHSSNRVFGFVHPDTAPHQHNLHMLDRVFLSNFLCSKITGMNSDPNNYWVPCYHPCTIIEHLANSHYCNPHLVGVGHVVIDKDSTLIGLATWACTIHSSQYTSHKRLPVGIAIPNSEAYYKNLECATKIRDSDMSNFTKGYYKSMCPA